MKNCIICNRNVETRLGVCFDCAEAESIIKDGTDMYDNPIPHHDGFSTKMDKLKYILTKHNLIQQTNNQ